MNKFNSIPSHTVILLVWLSLMVLASSMALYSVKFIEQNDSRLVATSDFNYALTSPKLLVKNWRSVSVNGDSVLIVTTTGEKIATNRQALGDVDMTFFESIRNEIATSNGAYTHTTSLGGLDGGSSFTMTSSGVPSSGSSSSSSSLSTSSSSSFTSATSGQYSSNNKNNGQLNRKDLSINMRDDNNFSVSRSDFPFEWSRVFINGDLVTFVYRNGNVQMFSMVSLELSQLESINKLKLEVKEMQRTQNQQLSNTMQQSMDMVSNVFNNIMGSFPKPPDYKASVGNMFGDNFPFGTRNSPFGAAAGWPFAGDGPFAGAFAGPL